MKNRPFRKLVLLALLLTAPAHAETINPKLEAKDLLSGKPAAVGAGKRGLVALFLSAKCPCSNSHLAALKELAQRHPDFSFVAVHSNSDEAKEPSQAYFKAAALSFPVLQDTGAKLADRFRALKTPHAFVLSPSGELLFKGGVSDSSDYAAAKAHYLADALSDIEAGKPVRTNTARTLGCVIARGEKNDW